jgi:hypothetical protein
MRKWPIKEGSNATWLFSRSFSGKGMLQTWRSSMFHRRTCLTEKFRAASDNFQKQRDEEQIQLKNSNQKYSLPPN